MKRIVIAAALVFAAFSAPRAHAEDRKAPPKRERKADKKADAPPVTYLDLSGPAEPDDAMPAITPKGKL